MIKKLLRHPLLCIFALLLAALTAADILLPTREFSDLENRYLAQPPKATRRAVVEGSFMTKYEEYLGDQFVGRDAWISLKSIAETGLGKIENNGVAYGADGYLFEKAAPVNRRQLERNLAHVEGFVEENPGLSVTVTLIPNSTAILTEKLPAGMQTVDQLADIRAAYTGPLAPNACDISPALLAHAHEDIYYRTDHHWTTHGAYLAYCAYMEHLGRAPQPPPGEANVVEDFYGTYYSKAKKFGQQPDQIHWYSIPTTSVTVNGDSVPGLYDLEKFTQRDKYAAFLHGNNGHTVIRSDGGEGKLLLVKDSYGNSLAPFLAQSFAEVHVVDLRYYNDIPGLLQAESFDQIYLLYNYASFTTDTNIFHLRQKQA